MVPEAPLQQTEAGLVPEGDGLTAGRLVELAAMQRGLLLREERDAEDDEPAHA